MKKIALALCVVAGLSVQAQDTTVMGNLVRRFAAEGKFNGSVLVAKNGLPVYITAVGFSNREDKTANTTAGIFQIGSVTKQMTAALVMKMQELGKLNINDKLSKYFPSFPHAEEVTLKQLLNHTSGIHNYTDDPKMMSRDVRRTYSGDSMRTIFASYPMDFKPGTDWNYSNSGYSLLGYVVEKASGMTYEAAMRKYIFQPLGMTSTGFDFTHLSSPNKAKGYMTVGSKLMTAPIVDSTISYSAGAVYSTTPDLLKWANAVDERKILNASSWKQVFTPGLHNYGFGWGIDSLYGHLRQSHSGGIHGFSSFMLRLPNDRITVIALDNTMGRNAAKLSADLAGIMLGKTVEMPATSITLSEEELKEYVGEYELDPQSVITITVKDGILYGQATGQSAFEMFASSKDNFYLKVVEAKVDFQRDESGKVMALTLHQSGMDMQGRKK